MSDKVDTWPYEYLLDFDIQAVDGALPVFNRQEFSELIFERTGTSPGSITYTISFQDPNQSLDEMRTNPRKIIAGWYDMRAVKGNRTHISFVPSNKLSDEYDNAEVVHRIAKLFLVLFGNWLWFDLDRLTKLEPLPDYEFGVAARKALQVLNNNPLSPPETKDPIDKRILELVTLDPDLTDEELGAKLGLSRQAVNPRRKALEKMGYKVR